MTRTLSCLAIQIPASSSHAISVTAHHYEAKRYKPGTLTEEVANIYKAQEKAFKDGWVVNVQKCQHCKGAGMVLSEQQNVW